MSRSHKHWEMLSADEDLERIQFIFRNQLQKSLTLLPTVWGSAFPQHQVRNSSYVWNTWLPKTMPLRVKPGYFLGVKRCWNVNWEVSGFQRPRFESRQGKQMSCYLLPPHQLFPPPPSQPPHTDTYWHYKWWYTMMGVAHMNVDTWVHEVGHFAIWLCAEQIVS
jgi:hypothetical protein